MALALCDTQTNEQGRELAQHGTAQFPIACYDDDLSMDMVSWHWHPELEAFVVSEGTAAAAVGAERFTMGPGQGLFINAQQLHAAWKLDDSGCRLHSVVFHPQLVGGNLDSIFWSKYLQPLLGEGGPKWACLDGSEGWRREAVQAVEEAWHSCAGEPQDYEFRTRDALSRLVCLLTRHYAPAGRAKSGNLLRDEGRVKLMLEHIHQNYAGPLTTASIAAAAAVGESECLRCFRRVIGLPPIRYAARYRVQKAAELLTSAPELSVAEAGARCGFQDASYFAKTFHALKGCAPSEYRRRGRLNTAQRPTG